MSKEIIITTQNKPIAEQQNLPQADNNTPPQKTLNRIQRLIDTFLLCQARTLPEYYLLEPPNK